jgi:enoyl-CoA hydratase
MNALSAELLDTLGEVVAELAADLPGAVVLWGGPRIFAAGADISELGEPTAAAVVDRFHSVAGALASLPRVTIAAVNGYALGGGLELALACDLRVASDTAKLGLPEVLLGVLPGGGGTQRLPRLIGPARAKQMLFTGRHVGADEALSFGLVDRVVPGDAGDEALSMAAEMARGPLAAHALIKHAVDAGLDGSLSDGLAIERRVFVEVFRTEDARTGVASFLAHGPGRAVFAGR